MKKNLYSTLSSLFFYDIFYDPSTGSLKSTFYKFFVSRRIFWNLLESFVLWLDKDDAVKKYYARCSR